MASIGIIGAGTWGTALGRMLCRLGSEVVIWGSDPERIACLNRNHVHRNLPQITLPEELLFTDDMQQVCTGRDCILFAVPSVRVRAAAAEARPYLPDGQLIVDVAKGIEPETLYPMTRVIADELQKDGRHGHVRLVALSGPTHAEEVAQDLPSAIVSSSEDLAAAAAVQELFMNSSLRVYTNPDLKGIELCGAMKNIIAIASGISEGLGNGDNARAALITRGMAEIKRLGVAMGCDPHTFSGLAGIGDLIVTATSRHSRNFRCGILIGGGMAPADAVREIGMVVEGINALPAAMQLMRKYGVDMPIIAGVNALVFEGADPRQTLYSLMTRDRKNESMDMPPSSGL